jgi:hypothetical protein
MSSDQPLCLVRISGLPSQHTFCPVDNKSTPGMSLCENQGVCQAVSRPGTFSPDQTGGACPKENDPDGCPDGFTCSGGVCHKPRPCSPDTCALVVNGLGQQSGYIPKGADPLTASMFACTPPASTASADSVCVCAPGSTGRFCDQSTTVGLGGAACTESTDGCDCVSGVCAPCKPGYTGLDCGMKIELLGAGTCACPDGWAGPTCTTGGFGGTEAWCRGDDQPQALAAYKLAQSACIINQQFRGTAAVTPVPGKDQPTVPCVNPVVAGGTTSDRQCADDDGCPGASTCAAAPVACSATRPCTNGQTCGPAGTCQCATDADCAGSAGGFTCDAATKACMVKKCTVLPCDNAKQCTVGTDCRSGVCNTASGACSCGGAGQCGPGLGCDSDLDVCVESRCAASQCVPFEPLTSLTSTTCDPIMMAAADQTAVVGRLNLGTAHYTRVPLPGAVFDVKASTGQADSLATVDQHLPTTVHVRANGPQPTYPTAGTETSTCSDHELQLRNAVGTERTAETADVLIADKPVPGAFGGQVPVRDLPDVSYVPPFPARYCGTPGRL